MRNLFVYCSAWTLLLGIASHVVAAGQQGTTLDPNQPYKVTKSNPVTYEVDFRAVVTAPYKCKLLKVWMPIPPTDEIQQVLESEFSTFPEEAKPQIATESVYGNKFAFFEFPNPQGGQIIRHKFKIKIYESRWNLDAKQVTRVEKWPDSFSSYLRSESQAVVLNDQIRSLAMATVKKEGDPAANITGVLNWIDENMKYNHVNSSLAASSLFAIENREGHCSDYHGLCASMGRALGNPTRVTYGINTFPKNSPSHCKLEVYLPPYGWVSFDVSETQRMCTSIAANEKLDENSRKELMEAAKQRLLRGYRDNTWYLQTRGTDYDLAPKATKRVAVVRTIYAEADGVPLKECDAANEKTREFTWMTSHKYKADRKVTYPFTDLDHLKSVKSTQ